MFKANPSDPFGNMLIAGMDKHNDRVLAERRDAYKDQQEERRHKELLAKEIEANKIAVEANVISKAANKRSSVSIVVSIIAIVVSIASVLLNIFLTK